MQVVEERPIRWKPEAIELAEREGVDLSLLESSLRMTLAKRFEANAGALKLVRALESGRKKQRARSRQDSQKAGGS